MKIAIVSPQSIPLVLGGAENLWWGLQQHFQSHTDHDCDIISVMSPEGSFWDLVNSYETFSKLDLSAYDCVISGKYPAWMVNHPNHICYMLHRLRGLYDTYAPVQHDISWLKHPKIHNFALWLKDGIRQPYPDQIPELFDRLRAIRAVDLPEGALAFPGPLSRLVVHFLDNAALSPTRIRKYAAISMTVANRKAYFPPDTAIDVLYPPPHRDNYHCAEGSYFFTSSRLDRPKRIDLLIKAMKLVRKDIPFLIAGTGPEEEHLKILAGEDSRIRFLGYVPDDKMPELYAGARAVPFVPSDEDYGLITIEAMRSSKPVLTVSDSGGPCEFVEHGETGFVCEPRPEALAIHLEQLALDEELAKQLGQAASRKVEAISWSNVVKGLLEPPAPLLTASRKVRQKLTVATTFKVFPPMNGGQARVFHLYRNLAKEFDIDIISLGATSDTRSEVEIAPGVMEITIPKSDAHGDAEHQVSLLVEDRPVGDVAAAALLGLTPAYKDALEVSAMTSMAVIACHPYMVDVLKQASYGKPLWYEAQDVETTLKTAVFGNIPEAKALLEEVKTVERECWITAERVFACANRDLLELERIYGPTRARLHEVPNGVSLSDIAYKSLSERRRLQSVAGIRDRQLAIFLGSWHGPNLEAVEDVLLHAQESPQTRFVIIGSVCLPFKSRALPDNVELMGIVDTETRDAMMAIADVALNPMRSGSGTNLKMLDYMAAGIPVISTEFGARGLTIKPDQHYLQADTVGLHKTLLAIVSMNDADLERMILQARSIVEQDYSWEVIADRFALELEEIK
jgi:glycosyltransferase involved in cell wall biosynthesis